MQPTPCRVGSYRIRPPVSSRPSRPIAWGMVGPGQASSAFWRLSDAAARFRSFFDQFLMQSDFIALSSGNLRPGHIAAVYPYTLHVNWLRTGTCNLLQLHCFLRCSGLQSESADPGYPLSRSCNREKGVCVFGLTRGTGGTAFSASVTRK